MIDFTAKQGAILQLIEFQPVHKDNVHPWHTYHSNLHDIEAWLETKALHTIERKLHHRKQYVIQRDGGTARVEVVKPMHNSEFCQNCTRLRVTSTGKLKPCLLRNDNLVDTVSYLRGSSDLAGLKDAFHTAVDCREPYWQQ